MATSVKTDPHLARLMQTASEAQRRGDVRGAQSLFEQVLARDPRHPAALNALGLMALRAGDAARARVMFTRAIEADSGAEPLRLNLATACRQGGDVAGERAALEGVLAIDQRNIMGNFRLAELLDRIGEEKRAIGHWQGLAQLLSGLPDRSGDIGVILDAAQRRLMEHGTALANVLDLALADRLHPLEPSERRRFDAARDAMLGRRRIYRNECHGLDFPFLPADEFFDRTHFPWIEAFEANFPAIRQELEALIATGEGMVPYVSMEAGTPANKWSALDHKLDWSAFYLWRYGAVQPEAARCPATMAALAQVPMADMPGRGPTAFFSILKPHTRLPAHSGVSNVRAIVHLPLVVPPDCGFRVGGETREWREGEAFVFDDTIEHEAWNDSDQLRAVLICDVWNPHLTDVERDLLRTLFATMDASGHDAGRAAGVVD